MGINQDKIVESYLKYFHKVGNPNQHLDLGTIGPEVRNVTTALHALHYKVRVSGQYTAPVKNAVLKFQQGLKHQNEDGIVGPGTRTRLVRTLLATNEHGTDVFRILVPTGPSGFFSLFLSYASVDTLFADDIQSGLYQMGFVVKRDSTAFEFQGGPLKGAIQRTIESVDKVLTVVTDASLHSDWVTYETQVSDAVREWKVAPFSLYLKLTGKDMPKYLSEMLFIEGHGKSLKDIGDRIRAVFAHEDLPVQSKPVSLNKVMAP